MPTRRGAANPERPAAASASVYDLRTTALEAGMMGSSRIRRFQRAGNRHGQAMKVTVILFLAGLPGPVGAQAPQEWVATFQLESGSGQHCQLGHNGKMSVKDNVLSWTPSGWPFAVWSVPLARDGSADKIVQLHRPGSHARSALVTVPSGVGPRKIATLDQQSACRHRYIPD